MIIKRAGMIVSVVSIVALAACASVRPITIETRITPRTDLPEFHRVLIAGFVAVGLSEDLDVNAETIRLLHSQFRSRTSLRVIGSDAVLETGHTPELLFADTAFWRRLGEEYLDPLIITGTIRFVPVSRSDNVQRTDEAFDDIGRRRVSTALDYVRTEGYRLEPTFVLIDGGNGRVLQSLTFREEQLHNVNRPVPQLAAYFELMDRILPAFLATVRATDQSIRVSRMLLQ